MQDNRSGFSLMELLVVMVMVALIAGVAIPNYRSYVVKAKIAGTFKVLQDAKDRAMRGYIQKGQFPCGGGVGCTVDPDYADANFDNLTEEIASIHYRTGAAAVGDYGADAATAMGSIEVGLKSDIVPNVSAPTISLLILPKAATVESFFWKCTTMVSTKAANSIPSEYLPSGCVIP